MSKALFLAPRILSFIFVIFLSLFALDVFSEYSGVEVILPLLIHLIPSVILLIISIIAWKYDLVGGAVFIAAALFYIWNVGSDRHWTWYAFISGPAMLVGILYLITWRMKMRN